MMKFTLLILSCLGLFNIAAHADPGHTSNNAGGHQQEAGLGMGAIIGGLIAGPPGAIIGAAGGAWFGDRENHKDIERTKLARDLLEKQGEVAYLQDEYQQLQSSFGAQLRKVKLQKQQHDLEALSHGVSLSVYFRTNSATIDTAVAPRIAKLAAYLKHFPQIQLQLEAHADRRGPERYNRQLSRQRAQAIRRELIRAAIDGKRIHIHAWGESAARAPAGDVEGYAFDRRVNIHLTLNTEI